MSSPAPSDAGAKPRKDEQITFRFCSECSNMLYPKEDEDNHKLQFTCRTCQYTEEATSTCIFRHSLSNTAGETAGVTQDVGSDPTVGIPLPSGHRPSERASSSRVAQHNVLCVQCGDVVRCRVCDDVLVPESVEDIVEEDADNEMDYVDYHDPLDCHHPVDDDIDESSEESLVESLQSTGMILSPEELLWYAGETGQPDKNDYDDSYEYDDYDDYDDEDLMEDYVADQTCWN